MRNSFKGFMSGFVVAVILLAFALPTFAAWQKQATLNYNNIKISLDGQALAPKDAAGNTVEPFIIDGTTYLPVRAIADAIGLSASWDATTQTVKLSTSSKDAYNETTNDKIGEIRNWLVGDIWNKGICDFSHYFYNGTSATGETMDPVFALQQLEKAMAKKEAYDSYMSTLSGSYAEFAQYWIKISEQVDVIYAEIKSRELTASGETLDTGLFSQYFDAFDDAYYELIY